MRFNEIIETIDTHTSGEPTRIILSGLPLLKGNSVLEKRNYFKENYDYIRHRLTYEPRGHAGMLCAAIVPPVNQNAHVGVFYFDDVQYLDMCGHATIGVGTALAEIGFVAKENINNFTIETPAGLVKIKNDYEDGVVKGTSIMNVPSFVVKRDLVINIEGVGEVITDIAYGGNYFAIVRADKFGLKLIPDNVDKIKFWAKEVRQSVNKKLEKIGIEVTLIQWYHDSLGSNANLRCVHSSGEGSPDRSPGGTGTSAKLAVLFEQGKLSVNEDFVQEGLVGGMFTGRILEVKKSDGKTFITPQITGEAHITGFHKFVFDDSDELRNGFFMAK